MEELMADAVTLLAKDPAPLARRVSILINWE
jgi:hypothetical protein